MFETQKEVLKTYDEVGCAWIERVKPEVGLWPELATKLSASRTMPAGLQACQNTFAQRRQMSRMMAVICSMTAKRSSRACRALCLTDARRITAEVRSLTDSRVRRLYGFFRWQ